MINIRIFEINDSLDQRVCYIPNVTYQNVPYWFGQTRRDLKMDLLLPFDYANQAQHPVVLWLSGGSWQMMDRSSYLPELVYLAKAGYVVASIDYRMGSEGAFPCQIADVRQALTHLKSQETTYKLNLNDITLMGDSAGGHLALLAAYTMARQTSLGLDLGPAHPIKQVVAYYAPTDLVQLQRFYDQTLAPAESFDYLAPIAFLLRQMQATSMALSTASPIHYIAPDLPRTLLLQGDADHWVPFEQATMLVEALQQAHNDVELFKLVHGDHIDARFFTAPIKQAVLAFLQS